MSKWVERSEFGVSVYAWYSPVILHQILHYNTSINEKPASLDELQSTNRIRVPQHSSTVMSFPAVPHSPVKQLSVDMPLLSSDLEER